MNRLQDASSTDSPWHLLLPLLASLLFVCGLLAIKAAARRGIHSWSITFFANQWAALVFSGLWLFDDSPVSWHLWWQPATIAGLYILGQVFTFVAVRSGDVSVAAPILGVKVILVACMLAWLLGEPLRASEWCAVLLSAVGVGMVQWHSSAPRTGDGPRSNHEVAFEPPRRLATAMSAVLAATSFAAFDIAVQSWSSHWHPSRLLPLVFWIVAIVSLAFLPVVQFHALRDSRVSRSVLGGTLLIALQALCIVLTLAIFGDAARVNVVYSLRGAWAVLLAWLVAVRWGGNEAIVGRRTMLMRLAGAVLLTVAVVLVISAAGAGNPGAGR